MNSFKLYSRKICTDHPHTEDFPLHIHDNYEIYYLLSGQVTYSVEGNLYQLFPGDIILLNKGEAHHPIVTEGVPYTRLYVNFTLADTPDNTIANDFMTVFSNKPFGKNNHFSSLQFTDNHWDFYLHTIHETDDSTKKQVFLMALLLELTECYSSIKQPTLKYASNSIYEITQYIDQHLTQPLTLEQICALFFISQSQITRNFKKYLGTTVGDYITSKRLILAKEYLSRGQKPFATYKKCGFQDYSTFFRAYKKKFGIAPTDLH